jgi:hypothetical protein
MDSLMSQPTLGHIRQALKNLPQGIKGLDETYERVTRKVEGQEEGYQELAKQVLSWVTYAKKSAFHHGDTARPLLSGGTWRIWMKISFLKLRFSVLYAP